MIIVHALVKVTVAIVVTLFVAAWGFCELVKRGCIAVDQFVDGLMESEK